MEILSPAEALIASNRRLLRECLDEIGSAKSIRFAPPKMSDEEWLRQGSCRSDQNLIFMPPYTAKGAAGVMVRGFSSTVALRPTPTGSPATLRKASVSK